MNPNPIELLKSASALEEVPHSDRLCLDHIVSDISKRSQIDSIILFGSRARKTHRYDSDTDVMVITDIQLEDSFVYENLIEYNKMYRSNLSISIVSKIEWETPTYEESLEIKSNIEKEGIKLFLKL